jgi:hypothetical protein
VASRDQECDEGNDSESLSRSEDLYSLIDAVSAQATTQSATRIVIEDGANGTGVCKHSGYLTKSDWHGGLMGMVHDAVPYKSNGSSCLRWHDESKLLSVWFVGRDAEAR